ncbi:MAG: DEAD/DEAH box helicase [Deltaproteobacteria bacterium]|nr:DEAD/DEAH box helicase [Deltaproteobacteria bacterium]
MNVFRLRDRLIADYQKYISGFIQIRDDHIRAKVEDEMGEGLLWPDPLLQLNPCFEPGDSIDELVEKGVLHEECRRIFRKGKLKDKHQADAVKIARQGHNYILTSGTGSGKSLAYIIPIVDHALRKGSGKGHCGLPHERSGQQPGR